MVVIIMGVSGSGKTTVGLELAREAGGTFFDADDYHSAANVAKMRRGEPLTEADREPWLAALRKLVDAWRTDERLAVLACSALTRSSREKLGVARPGIALVFLHGSAELIQARMRARDHFMPPELLASQIETLEPPEDALSLDVSLPVAALVARIRAQWRL